MSTDETWARYAARGDFVSWAFIGDESGSVAAKPIENRRIAILRSCGGLIWVDLYIDHRGSSVTFRQSSGAFYDVPDHPEGAEEWARVSALAYLEKARETLREYDRESARLAKRRGGNLERGKGNG